MDTVQTNLRPSAKALEDAIKNKDYGVFISFEELNSIAGVDITQPKYRYLLEAARKALMSHHDRVLVSVRGKGYQVADLNHCLAASSSYRKRSFKAAKTAMNVIKTINLVGLSESDKKACLNEQAKSAALIVVYNATENRAVVEQGPNTEIQQPTEASILKLLLKN